MGIWKPCSWRGKGSKLKSAEGELSCMCVPEDSRESPLWSHETPHTPGRVAGPGIPEEKQEGVQDISEGWRVAVACRKFLLMSPGLTILRVLQMLEKNGAQEWEGSSGSCPLMTFAFPST